MVNVRGVNVYPSAVESVVRRFSEIGEYRATVSAHGALRELSVEIELTASADGQADVARRVGDALRESLGLAVPLRVVATNTLPRFELKARRFVIGD
jgi:phenylacetate-CoA ligase